MPQTSAISQNSDCQIDPIYYVGKHEEKDRLLINQTSDCMKRKDVNCGWIPVRFFLAFWTFLGLFVAYSLRANLGVAIVAMVNKTVVLENNTANYICSKVPNANDSSYDSEEDGEFLWDGRTQGIILGAFFYGYFITQLPGGLLAEKFGGKWLFGGGILITSLATLLTPIAAKFHISSLITVRVIAGLGEGSTFPSFYALYSYWVPSQERSRILAITVCGAQLGTIVAMPATAWLCDHGFDDGWPSVFYIFGTVGCIWFVFWTIFIYDVPEKHPYITAKELKYIQENRESSKQHLMWTAVPWKAILTSFPVWALAFAKFSGSWTYYTMLTELPNYMKSVLNYPLKQNGYLNSLLYIATAVTIMASGAISDFQRSQAHLSTTTIRKLYVGIASFGIAVMLCLVPYMGCNKDGVICLLIISMAFLGLNGGGETPVALDMAPDYVGVIFGITNCFSSTSGFLAPLATGLIIQDDESGNKWNYVFYLTAVINIIGGAGFLFFGSARVQPWCKSLVEQSCNFHNEIAENSENDKSKVFKYIEINPTL